MAFGDVGGVVTELVLTCVAPASGPVNISRGDALKLTGDYTVTNATAADDPVFGQALTDAAANGATVAVRVRGIAVFEYTGETPPTVDGRAGVAASATAGKVKPPASGNGRGVNLKVDETARRVHVLL